MAAADRPDDQTSTQPYRVLARKYRPSSFADLVGQETLVRTLTNAIQSGRLAHAFILTGVRGVGKTTSARIVARALNCIGPDGTGGPTPEPCGVCANCVAIAEDRHVDVLELDAASRTGIDDVRELIDGVRYAPTSARYKVYIIDEVHMLSKQAFNGLLKTLEEPPPHVKFIFATTEIRKVPITVLSRCQRFDLRRLDTDELIGLLGKILEKEDIPAETEAVALIARAADGSARDGLSLLDQAIAQGDGTVAEEPVRIMLGLADRTVVFDLYERLMGGQMTEALETLDQLHRNGAEAPVILQDLLDLTHFLTRAKLSPNILSRPGLPEAERNRGGALAEGLSLPILARAWQMLLKGVGEVQSAPAPQAALEMVLIRLVHAGMLPTPGDLLRKIEAGEIADGSVRMGAAASDGGGHNQADAAPPTSGDGARAGLAVLPQAAQPMPAPAAAPEIVAENTPAADPMPTNFSQLANLFERRADGLLYAAFHAHVHPVHLEPGRFEFRPSETAPADLANRIGARLGDWTGQRWMVTVSGEPGGPTLKEREAQATSAAREKALAHPTVKAVLEAFPGARLDTVRMFDDEVGDDGAGDPPVDSALPDDEIADDDL
ncbi:MAG: DNA polymerase III subunit gamma/tau [Pseudomonadota bacterium]